MPEPSDAIAAAGPRKRLSLAEYQLELLSLVEPSGRSEVLELGHAMARVSAQEIRALVANPAFANSAMDGYAVRHAAMSEVPVRLRVVGDIPAGSAADPRFGNGECVRIMTGAPLPSSADTVVAVEHTDGGTDWVTIQQVPARKGLHVRLAAEDYPLGAKIAGAGSWLTPGLLGAIAAAGHTHVAVRPKPRVVVCATGDELVRDGAPLARGQIYDSNSQTLAAALHRDGAAVSRARSISDDAVQLVAWLDAATTDADLVVLTGGASVGAYDVVRDVLSARGGVFRQVRVQPGKPQGWARWNGTPVVSLPGNPMSAALCYEIFVQPMLSRILGTKPPPRYLAQAKVGWECPAGRVQLMPVVASTTEVGQRVVTPAHRRGSASHLVTSLALANGIAVIGEATETVRAGDLVEVHPL